MTHKLAALPIPSGWVVYWHTLTSQEPLLPDGSFDPEFWNDSEDIFWMEQLSFSHWLRDALSTAEHNGRLFARADLDAAAGVLAAAERRHQAAPAPHLRFDLGWMGGKTPTGEYVLNLESSATPLPLHAYRTRVTADLIAHFSYCLANLDAVLASAPGVPAECLPPAWPAAQPAGRPLAALRLTTNWIVHRNELSASEPLLPDGAVNPHFHGAENLLWLEYLDLAATVRYAGQLATRIAGPFGEHHLAEAENVWRAGHQCRQPQTNGLHLAVGWYGPRATGHYRLEVLRDYGATVLHHYETPTTAALLLHLNNLLDTAYQLARAE